MFLSNFSLRIRVYAFFIVLVFVSTFNFGMMIHLENRSIENYADVNDTHDVIEKSEQFLGFLTDAETGQRGYLLTNDLDYLEPYYSGVNNANQSLDYLKTRTADYPHQQQRLKKIEQLMREKLSELKQTIDLNKLKGMERAVASVTTGRGKALMDNIRAELVLFNKEERRLLQVSHNSLITLQEQIRIIFIVESITFAIVLTLLGLIVSRTILSPIHQLCSSVRAFEIDKRFEPVNVKSRDEIGILASAFNFMGGRIEKAAASLIETIEVTEIERDKALLQSVSDPLTGLFNRRYMEVELNKLMSASKRYGDALSVVMVDIDHFKGVNDNFGHVVGDTVLKQLAELLNQEVRGSDLAIRYGGEEFTLVLTHTGADDARAKAESIRNKVAAMDIAQLKGDFITISLGITELKASDEQIQQVISRADEALYQAKNNGRNCSQVIL